MKKILSAVLLGALFAVASYANAERLVKIYPQVQERVEQLQLEKRKAQLTTAKFRIMIDLDESGLATYDTVYCSAVFMDYNEKDGLGNVTVGIQPSCVNLATRFSFAVAVDSYKGWMAFAVDLTDFGYNPIRNDDIDDFMYTTELNADSDKTYPDLKLKKTQKGDLYIFHMPVPSARQQIQKGFKNLFPSKENFLTLEGAAQILKLMPEGKIIQE